MIELIIGTYGLLCWLIFKKFKLVPVNAYTIFTAILGGIVILATLYVLLSVYHPVSNDGRMYAAVVQIVPNVRRHGRRSAHRGKQADQEGRRAVPHRAAAIPDGSRPTSSPAGVEEHNVAQLSEQLAAAHGCNGGSQGQLARCRVAVRPAGA